MRAIDADRLLEERRVKLYYHLPNGDIAIPIIDIEHAPTIAQPETIRCRDCKHYKRYKYTGDFACHYVIGGTVRREPDDFCSRAERTELADELVKEADHGTD